MDRFRFVSPVLGVELLALTALALVATGCDEGFANEAVSFDRMEVRDIDWTQVDSDFVFQVNNPLFFDLGVARFDYTLELAGADVAFGDAEEGLVLEAGGGELAFPVGLVFAEVYELAEASRGEDTMPFVFAGSVGFDTELGPVDLPFEAEGDFPALRAPQVRLDSLAVSQLDASGATLDIGLLIDNEHGSTLLFEDLDYGLSLDGFDVASGRVAQLGDAAAGETQVDLPVSVDFLDLGGAALSALTSGGEVDVALGATAEVETPFGPIPLEITAADGLRVAN